MELDQVLKAVAALVTITKQKTTNNLFSELDYDQINLQFSFKKIPDVKNKIIRIKLPHSIYRNNQDVCLFVKDLDATNRDYSDTVRHFKDLLSEKNVTCITEVIPLKSLKLEYQPFEAKKNLSNRFSVFLAQDSIVRLLPAYLGKNFYGRKRQPVQVDLAAKNLKAEFDEAVNNTRCVISGRGSNSMLTCAHTGMTERQIAENIVAAATRLADSIPGGADNLKTVLIKTIDSMAIPVYTSLSSADGVELPGKSVEESDSEPEDVTTVVSGKVKVTKDGDIILFKRDGRRTNLTKDYGEQCVPKFQKTLLDRQAKKRKLKAAKAALQAKKKKVAVKGKKKVLKAGDKLLVKPNKEALKTKSIDKESLPLKRTAIKAKSTDEPSLKIKRKARKVKSTDEAPLKIKRKAIKAKSTDEAPLKIKRKALTAKSSDEAPVKIKRDVLKAKSSDKSIIKVKKAKQLSNQSVKSRKRKA